MTRNMSIVVHTLANNYTLHSQKQTKNTYSSHDPAFPYLLLFFLFLTSLAWSLAYADPSFGNIVRIALTFTTVHCLLSSVTIATFMYLFVDRALGPGGWLTGRPGSGRRRGMFSNVGVQGESELEFGFCFDVSSRHCRHDMQISSKTMR